MKIKFVIFSISLISFTSTYAGQSSFAEERKNEDSTLQIDLQKGLVAYYPFNSNANDESGNGHHGTIYGATLTSDRYGNSNSAYRFNGIEDYIVVEDGTSFNFCSTNSFSLFVWIKPDSIQADFAGIIDKSHAHNINGGVLKGFFIEKSNTNYLSFYGGYGCGNLNCEGINYGYDHNIIANANMWNALTITVKDGIIKYYLNGTLVDSFQESPSIASNDSLPLIIGGTNNWTRFYKGLIDDIRIYDRALTEQEIRELCGDNISIHSIYVGSDTIARVGKIIEIPVTSSTLQNDDSIISYQFSMTYDYNKLEFLECNLTGTITEGGMISVNSETPGKISVGYINSAPIQGTGSISKLKFRVTGQGNSALIISGFLYNADMVTQITNGYVTAFLYGDVDANKTVQAYDAALTLQHSVGLGSFWNAWLNETADVDSVPGITAYDAALILQKSTGLITCFPIENMQKSTQTNDADVNIKVENNNIVFYSKGNLFSLNVYSDNSKNILGDPVLLEKSMIYACNNQYNAYGIGVATAYPAKENTMLIKIPYIKNGSVTFDMIVNTEEKSVTLDILTGNVLFSSAGISIYPNPASDILTISGTVKPTIANIYTTNGQLMKTITLHNSTNDISINNLPNGFYIIKLHMDKEIAVKRFVKQ